VNNLKDLRAVTDKVLYSLTADDSLKHRILQQASQSEQKSEKKPFYLIPVLCSVLTLLLITAVVLNGLQPVSPAAPGEINVFTAGSDSTSSVQKNNFCPVDSSVSADSVIFIELTGVGSTSAPQQCAQLFIALRDEAVPAEAELLFPRSELSISLLDGSVIRFSAEEPYIADGEECWTCPAFFELAAQFLTE
jgi:hypothetical protein